MLKDFSTKPNVSTNFLEFGLSQISYQFYQTFDQKGEMTSPHALVILINGFGRPGKDFQNFIQRLQGNCPDLAVLTFDNVGVGNTTTDYKEMTIPLMAQHSTALVSHIMQTHGISRWSVWGTSMGGLISQCLAAYAKDWGLSPPHSLILVNSISGGQPFQDQKVFPVGDMDRYFSDRFKTQNSIYFKSLKKKLEQEQTDPPSPGLLLQRQAIESYHSAFCAPFIHCPSLVITGLGDRVTPAYLSRGIVDRLAGPSTYLEYPDVGHLMLVEAPEALAQDTGVFLRETLDL